MTIKPKVTLAKAIADWQSANQMRFTPTAAFYQTVCINRKRFGQLVKGQKCLYGFEARVLANFFQIKLTDLV